MKHYLIALIFLTLLTACGGSSGGGSSGGGNNNNNYIMLGDVAFDPATSQAALPAPWLAEPKDIYYFGTNALDIEISYSKCTIEGIPAIAIDVYLFEPVNYTISENARHCVALGVDGHIYRVYENYGQGELTWDPPQIEYHKTMLTQNPEIDTEWTFNEPKNNGYEEIRKIQAVDVVSPNVDGSFLELHSYPAGAGNDLDAMWLDDDLMPVELYTYTSSFESYFVLATSITVTANN